MTDGYDDFWAASESAPPLPRKRLSDLNALASQGIWAAFTEGQLAGTIAEIGGQPIAACYDISFTGTQHPRPDTAVFIAELVNAYREGRLVEIEPHKSEGQADAK